MDSSRGFSGLLKQGASMMSSNSEGGNNHHNNNNNNYNNGGSGSKPDFLHSAAASLFSSSSSSSPPPPASHSSTATSHADPANPHVSEGHPGKKPPPSTGELLSSAQVVFHAVKAKVGKKEDERPSEEIPTGKVAGAAANLLGAAAHYGKLDEAKYGKVIHKAEDYLHNYEAKHSATGSQGYTQPGKHH